ncbi:histidine kinase [Flavobacterium cyanobacteriorum]|uniref:Histidine kinase n=1 Tax=Flavobacterium cyanobacteriorum TaxID=2022802 RepID=A0A255Z5G5_9FLAO|nr:Hpt domain-containing protein [Flavobacterium cyanobacteriorum]OYQ36125.1 histidine kinase [Flavobacterium cyanobacteriorum]
MALTYNLLKVNAISDNDAQFARQVVTLFIEEVPFEIKNMKDGLRKKNHQKVYHAAHKIKPTLDLLGMDLAYEDVLTIEAWTRAEGKKKEIKEVIKSLKLQVDQTVRELIKDYNL